MQITILYEHLAKFPCMSVAAIGLALVAVGVRCVAWGTAGIPPGGIQAMPVSDSRVATCTRVER